MPRQNRQKVRKRASSAQLPPNSIQIPPCRLEAVEVVPTGAERDADRCGEQNKHQKRPAQVRPDIRPGPAVLDLRPGLQAELRGRRVAGGPEKLPLSDIFQQAVHQAERSDADAGLSARSVLRPSQDAAFRRQEEVSRVPRQNDLHRDSTGRQQGRFFKYNLMKLMV